MDKSKVTKIPKTKRPKYGMNETKDLWQLTNRAIWIMKANTEATTLRQSRPYIASRHSNMSILDRTDHLVKASINKGSVVKK